ncbi:MAG TPA: NGG1p interacting factor NIF3 [bacterium]|nr:NGG1p interacting factor NIF3 [bacterium]
MEAAKARRYKVVVFVPAEALARVRGAMARAGAGVIGDYTRCSFAAKGVGTFRGGEGAHPAAGTAGRFEEVNEWRLEMVAGEEVVAAVVAAMKAAHPYEEAAYDVYRLEDF